MEIPIPFLLFALVAIGVAVWPLYKRWQLQQWPFATGVIEASYSEDYGGGRSGNVARVRIRYAFDLQGGTYFGEYKRLFQDEDDARIFAAGLMGLPINVHYDPDDPSRSGVLDIDADLLQSRRPPLRPEELERKIDPPSSFAKVVSAPLMVAAATGFLLATAVNIAGWLGIIILPEMMFVPMHVGIFFVAGPAILLGRKKFSNPLGFRQTSGSLQTWLSITSKILFGYVFVNFFSFILMSPKGKSSGPATALNWRGFSGHWMLFYFMSFAVFYSIVNEPSGNRLCVNGHEMPAGSMSCPACGSARN